MGELRKDLRQATAALLKSAEDTRKAQLVSNYLFEARLALSARVEFPLVQPYRTKAMGEDDLREAMDRIDTASKDVEGFGDYVRSGGRLTL